MATVGGIDPNFTGQAPSGDPPYARVPSPQRLFGARAKRFAAVAVGSDIGEYLAFLAELSAAQHCRVEAARLPPLPTNVAQSLEHRMPPLSRDLAGEPGASETLDALLEDLKHRSLADGPRAIVESLVNSEREERQRLLQTVADGVYEIERLGESAIAAAALQVWYALHSAQIDETALRNVGETVCPCCGGAPASSTVVDWPNAQGNRYLTCSLCCTMWNLVRVKCTACGSEKGISYRSIEGSTGDIAAEVCESCQSYAKHLLQTKNALLEPVVDDVASYGLDLMLREDGWRRSGLNPFLILGS